MAGSPGRNGLAGAAIAALAIAAIALLWRPPAQAPEPAATAPARAPQQAAPAAPVPAAAATADLPAAAAPPTAAPPAAPPDAPDADAATAGADPPPPAPEPDRDMGGGSEEAPPPSRALVLASLRSAVERELPSHKLSSDQYDTLADAVLQMRAAREALARLPADAAHAARARELREQLGQAAADFEYVLEMSPAEFTALADSEGSIDWDDDPVAPADPEPSDDGGEDAPPEPEYLYQVAP
jgi:hypothetical protein